MPTSRQARPTTFPRGPRIWFINHGARPAPRCPARATPSQTAPRARPVRPLRRSFSRANARSPSTGPANPRAIDRDTDLFPRISPVPIVTRQRACGAETPGVAVPRRKPDRGTTCPCSVITPMTLRGSRSRRCVRASRRRNANPRADRRRFSFHARAAPGRVVFRRFYLCETLARLTVRLPREPSPEKQVVVLMMSVCFIAFVTMLHAVSKIYQYTSS